MKGLIAPRVLALLAAFILGYACLQNASAQVTNIYGSVTGHVADSNGKPVANAVVRMDNASNHLKAASDVNGLFVFANVPPGTYAMKVDAKGYDSVTRSGLQITAEPLNFDISLAPASSLKTIGHVTASAGSSINTTGAAIYTTSIQDFRAQGQTDWRRVLEETPGVNFETYVGAGDATFGAPGNLTEISIRGAAAYETATLLDNMPIINITQFDQYEGQGGNLNNFAPDSFANIAVVEGPGAASPTIVQSIGGSLNLRPGGTVTRNNYYFSLQNDIYGGLTFQSQTAYRIGKLSASLSYDNENSPGPQSGQAVRLPVRFSSQIGTISNSSGSYYFYCPSSCGSHAQYPNDASFEPLSYTSGFVACCSTQDTHWGQYSGSASLAYQVSPVTTASAFYAGSSQNQITAGYQYPVTFLPPAGYSGSIPAGSTDLYNYTFTYVPESIRQSSQLFEGKLVTQLGRGQLEVAGLTNVDVTQFGYTYPRTLSLQLFGGADLCTTSPCSSRNPTVMPTVFNGQTYNVTLKSPYYNEGVWGSARVDNRDSTISYTTPIGALRAGISRVTQFVDNPFIDIITDGRTGVGSLTLACTGMTANERVNEYKVSVGVDPTPRTAFDASFYDAAATFHILDPNATTSEVYQNVGDHYNGGRFTFGWRPSQDQTYRFSAGSGYALPTIGFISNTASYYFDSSNGSWYYYTPNPGEHPETSFGYDLGTDRRLPDGTILSLDLYKSDLWGQFGGSTVLSPDLYQGAPLYISTSFNLQHTRYEGIDLQLKHNPATGFYWSLAGDLERAFIVSLPQGFYDSPGQCVDCSNLCILAGPNFNGLNSGGGVPYSQAFGQMGYRWGPWQFVSIDSHYQGNNNAYGWPAFATFDANGRIAMGSHAALQVSFLNISGIHGLAVANEGQGRMYPAAFGAPLFYPNLNYQPRAVIAQLMFHE